MLAVIFLFLLFSIVLIKVSNAFTINKLSFWETLSADKNKNKIKLRNARNFLRPYDYSKTNKFVFANEFCILEFSQFRFNWFDKKHKKGYECFVNDNIAYEKFFNEICKRFNFNTTVTSIIDIAELYISVSLIKNSLSEQENSKLKQLSVNNLSIAELVSLPGMNMGKANKVYKFLEKNQFFSVDDFISFIQVNKASADAIYDIFSNCTNFPKLNNIQINLP